MTTVPLRLTEADLTPIKAICAGEVDEAGELGASDFDAVTALVCTALQLNLRPLRRELLEAFEQLDTKTAPPVVVGTVLGYRNLMAALDDPEPTIGDWSLSETIKLLTGYLSDDGAELDGDLMIAVGYVVGRAVLDLDTECLGQLAVALDESCELFERDDSAGDDDVAEEDSSTYGFVRICLELIEQARQYVLPSLPMLRDAGLGLLELLEASGDRDMELDVLTERALRKLGMSPGRVETMLLWLQERLLVVALDTDGRWSHVRIGPYGWRALHDSRLALETEKVAAA